jgi:hypothetical protein
VWGANAAPNGTSHDKSFVIARRRAVRMNNVWFFFGVRFANGAAAKFTGSVCRSFTMPTFHGKFTP